jgi:TRAP-type C4-dicarboxylate transport system substrate-binding protein
MKSLGNTVNRRTVLLGGLAAPYILRSSRASAATKVIVGDPSSADSIIGHAEALFKERAEKYSGGELAVQIYPNSQLGTFATMATQMKVDLVNVMFIQPDALGGQIPIITANSWPFMFHDAAEMLKAWNGPGGKALVAEVEKRSGYRMIAPSWNVPRWIYTTREATSLDSLKGMKIRVPETAIYVDQMRLLGLSPTPLSFAQTFTAMQQGVVEGIEGAISDMASLSMQDVSHSVVMTGHVLSPKAFLVYGPWLNRMSAKNKDAFIRAATEASDFYGQTTRADEQRLINTFKAKGVKFVAPGYSVEQMRAMVKPMEQQLPEIWTWAQRLMSA